MTELAPIVLFTYKRVDTLIITTEALQRNFLASQSDLIIFSDAAKCWEELRSVEIVREYLISIQGFKSVTIHLADENKGLAKSVIDGVSQVLESHCSVIVLEDDLVTSQNFLNFMNASLIKYKNEKRVFSISGFSFNLNIKNKLKSDMYFFNRGWSWGWATWKDRWQDIDWEISDYMQFISDKQSQREFSKGGSDLNGMLNRQMTGKLDSWAIRWFYNQFKVGGLTLYPVSSKIKNEGFGKDATHTSGSSKRYIPKFDEELNVDYSYPAKIELITEVRRRFLQKMGIIARIKSKIETLLGI